MPDSPPPTDPTVEKVAEWLAKLIGGSARDNEHRAQDLLDSCSLVPRSELEQVEADLAEMRAARSVQEDATTEQTFKAQRLKRELEQVQRERDDLQAAIDKAMSALYGSQYVGGPSEREAWQTVVEAIGPFETQHVGQDAALKDTEAPD